MKFVSFNKSLIKSVKEFCDIHIGLDYYTTSDLEDVINKSEGYSYIALEDNKVVAIRLTLIKNFLDYLLLYSRFWTSFP